MIRLLLAASVAALLGGCAATSHPTRWAKPGGTPQDFYRTKLACEVVAEGAPIPQAMWGMFTDCMMAEGYVQTAAR